MGENHRSRWIPFTKRQPSPAFIFKHRPEQTVKQTVDALTIWRLYMFNRDTIIIPKPIGIPNVTFTDNYFKLAQQILYNDTSVSNLGDISR